MKIIVLKQYQRMPWKNGAGTSHEIFSSAEPQKPNWRLSLAEMTQDAQFSQFVGKQRILTVVQGKGISLQDERQTQQVLPLEPHKFSGEESVFGRCLDGPVHNFNLIYDANHLEAQVQLRTAGSCAPSTAVYCVSGSACWADGSELQAGDTALWVEKSPQKVSANAQFVCVKMTHSQC